ncbi:MAG: pantoate--beta-alanine ligase [Bacteroidales bacterium]|nr:pantoate--beta-alanine ligase [Bacteroidales bacterium]
MIVYRTKNDLALHLDAIRDSGKSIGLVPTMGALHRGHTSLVEKAAGENEALVVSIFVNPTQFNDPVDLEKYPRTLDLDLEMLQSMNVDIVFVPSVKEMYPEEDNRTFDLGNLDKVLEGEQRTGHFNGVAQIVSKLFEAVKPTRAYFGQKDFQQLVIIRRLVKLLNLGLTIVACPIIREEDGLAMSSRNVRLSKEERNLAPFIHITLKLAREKSGTLSPAEIKSWVTSQFENQPLMNLEYFEIVEDKDLKPVAEWGDKVNIVFCIAVQFGEVRIIDNLIFD